MALLEVKGISKCFGGVRAMSRMSLSLERGEIVGLIGPNGAGKTSFFNAITGLIPVDEGEILFCGGRDRLHTLTPNRILEKGLARTFQNLRIFRNMTVLENVAVGMHTRTGYGLRDSLLRTRRYRVEEKMIWKRSMNLLEFIGMDALASETASNLSYGSQKKLEIARALASEPKLLLLDEPVAGMNSAEKEGVSKLVRAIRDKNIAVLLIEHDMRFVMPLSERVVVMDEGEKIAEGPPEEVQKHPRVIQAYLGEEAPDA